MESPSTSPPPPLVVRVANEHDAATIVEFNRRLAWETEQKTLDAERLQAGVLAVLRDASKGVYYVAEQGPVLVGQLLITYEWSDWRNGAIWWLQSVYVVEEARRQGVFRTLFEHVRAAQARDPAAIGLRLYVEAHNARAQATYDCLGFASAGYLVMEQFNRSAHGSNG